jgi:hypothetical protein
MASEGSSRYNHREWVNQSAPAVLEDMRTRQPRRKPPWEATREPTRPIETRRASAWGTILGPIDCPKDPTWSLDIQSVQQGQQKEWPPTSPYGPCCLGSLFGVVAVGVLGAKRAAIVSQRTRGSRTRVSHALGLRARHMPPENVKESPRLFLASENRYPTRGVGAPQWRLTISPFSRMTCLAQWPIHCLVLYKILCVTFHATTLSTLFSARLRPCPRPVR